MDAGLGKIIGIHFSCILCWELNLLNKAMLNKVRMLKLFWIMLKDILFSLAPIACNRFLQRAFPNFILDAMSKAIQSS